MWKTILNLLFAIVTAGALYASYYVYYFAAPTKWKDPALLEMDKEIIHQFLGPPTGSTKWDGGEVWIDDHGLFRYRLTIHYGGRVYSGPSYAETARDVSLKCDLIFPWDPKTIFWMPDYNYPANTSKTPVPAN